MTELLKNPLELTVQNKICNLNTFNSDIKPSGEKQLSRFKMKQVFLFDSDADLVRLI